ncbi:zinc-binding dehydrogenase [Sphingosinicella microcystinivorans]|uniref:Alcohol dehydrogenase n=1 Tax=Sphingosinicella microcystinivorans TaxID=335406 RepID=A0ABX9SZB2_SPHMI|nr:zinc-binding dehydrogenase [Sphingosinicella microcystinivorans]RKS89289.1 alcohol dehydrogenase [Sphingosinicella microcystinivorans]
MKAAITTAHGGRETIKIVEDWPDPVAGAGQVVVEIAACAVNFHDIFTRRGMPGIKLKLPVVVGSDIAGTISAVGSGVEGWSIGDRVLIDPVLREGAFGMIGETVDGGRASHIAVGTAQLVAIPDGVTLEQAAALPLAYGTAYRMMMTQGRVAEGDKVLVLGASGGVGAACVQLAKMVGAEVIACASSDSKLARLKDFGADHGINYATGTILDGVKAIYGKPRVTGGGGVDLAVNFTGGDTMKETQRCVTLGGRIVSCGATAGYDVGIDMRYLWSFEHHMIGSDGWAQSDLVALLDLIAAGKLDPIIDRVFPLEETAEAERLLEDREVVGKVLIRP